MILYKFYLAKWKKYEILKVFSWTSVEKLCIIVSM